MAEMIEVEGYKAFHGTMGIYNRSGALTLKDTGDWLYKPECDCWYCNGRSYSAESCKVLNECKILKEGE